MEFTIVRRNGNINYQLIPTGKGKHLVLWRKYTFSESNGIYYCSSKWKHKCSARIKLTKGKKILPIDLLHSHEPPNYHLTADGVYVKV
ncbi:Modifier of mdg4 [Operophtera brumata]|uniref:Modifier of mdg4 n=1 Tax=Operophtera brumata TaxID=104452 RepID=A0A0L7LP89_OPEBR|nr:Modifier of mdg4 [Operophtera brumata]